MDDTVGNISSTDDHVNHMMPAQNRPCVFVSEPYMAIVGDWISYFAIKRHLLHTNIPYPGQDGPKVCPGKLHLLHVDSCSLEDGLLSVSPPGPTDTPSYLTFNVVRFALYFTCGPAIDVAQPKTPTQRSCAVKLRTALEDAISFLLWYPCLDLLLWALTVAACVSNPLDEWKWIISKAAIICKELAIHSLEEFEKTIAPFGGVSESSARTVWTAIHEVEDAET